VDEASQNIFKSNLLNIFEHNLKQKNGEELFTMGLNQFTDMVRFEFF